MASHQRCSGEAARRSAGTRSRQGESKRGGSRARDRRPPFHSCEPGTVLESRSRAGLAQDQWTFQKAVRLCRGRRGRANRQHPTGTAGGTVAGSKARRSAGSLIFAGPHVIFGQRALPGIATSKYLFDSVESGPVVCKISVGRRKGCLTLG